jgi:hypothetical protein
MSGAASAAPSRGSEPSGAIARNADLLAKLGGFTEQGHIERQPSRGWAVPRPPQQLVGPRMLSYGASIATKSLPRGEEAKGAATPSCGARDLRLVPAE